MTPNIIERLESALYALDDASSVIEKDESLILPRIDDAAGILGEILTMIDGR